MKKFIFILNFPRGGGKSISKLKAVNLNKDIYLWPYEFFYFNLFNEATNNKKREKGIILNKFFYKEIKNRLYKSQNKKIDFLFFKKKLHKLDHKYFDNLNYLKFLTDSLALSYKNNKSENFKYCILNTTARGFDWSYKKKNSFIFFVTDRKFSDCFVSLRKKNFVTTGFKNFFLLDAKKSLFYWLETFRRIQIEYKKRYFEKKVLRLKFEDLKYNNKVRNEINDTNTKKILNYLRLKKNNYEKNFYYHHNKIDKRVDLANSPIEKYLVNNYINSKKLNFFIYFFKLIISVKFLFINIEHNNIKKFFYISKIIFSFIYFYFIKYKKEKLFNTLRSANKNITYMSLWR